MAKPVHTENTGRNHQGRKYEPSLVDRRFLKIVDLVLEKNRNAGIRPKTDRAISLVIFGDAGAMSKLRSGLRGVTMAQLEKFGIEFGLDFNCFFRDTTDDISYHPAAKEADFAAVKNTGKHTIITQVKGDHNGDIIGEVKGDLYKGNKIGQVIQKAEKIVNHHLDNPKQQEQFSELMGTIQKEAQGMESLIIRQHEDIKKMSEIYESQLLAAREKEAEIIRQRDEAREEERQTLKKYIHAIENGGKKPA